MVGVGNRGLFPSGSQGIGVAFALVSAVALASCSSITTGGNANLDVIDKVRSIDTLPRYPQQAGTPATDTRAHGQPAAVFPGSEEIPPGRPQSVASETGEYEVADARAQPVALVGGGYELNF